MIAIGLAGFMAQPRAESAKAQCEGKWHESIGGHAGAYFICEKHRECRDDKQCPRQVVHDGDLAEYAGTHKALAGLRCEVGSYTPTGKRVRCTVRLSDGRVVVRLIKPDNLKRVGGGG